MKVIEVERLCKIVPIKPICSDMKFCGQKSTKKESKGVKFSILHT